MVLLPNHSMEPPIWIDGSLYLKLPAELVELFDNCAVVRWNHGKDGRICIVPFDKVG